MSRELRTRAGARIACRPLTPDACAESELCRRPQSRARAVLRLVRRVSGRSGDEIGANRTSQDGNEHTLPADSPGRRLKRRGNQRLWQI
ncbi:hypothetical protein AAFF_G00025940 [Aldrovandia affinis]|uniref:Uncharacterized protein n=1 Tax=Aldrovandia affinis TaxID=143900 RepID=A0AAD7S4Z6_9TELE|nr:hypothetical protein AAFF_G00025940 [Aldrovandia affinis]